MYKIQKQIHSRCIHASELVIWCITISELYHGGQFIGGENQSTWRNPPTCRMSLTNFIT
jgi:hypothetical protein